MIIHFFLLVALCTTLPTQTSDDNLIDDKMIFGHVPPFSTTYIEQLDSQKTVRVDHEQYKSLQQNSLACIKHRIEDIETAYKLTSEFYTDQNSKIYYDIYYSMYIKLKKLFAICTKPYSQDKTRPNYTKVPIKNLLSNMQWIHIIIPSEPIRLKMHDGSVIALSKARTKLVLEHLKNNSSTQALYILQ